ncbi:hypothetical protein [Nocardia iowensis]|uniref:DUF2867 domain-containing protein n=1 Tax=Nocardia iowensis TaxID=204891 RepID=A0ABX8S0F3_NOCIO|nr:hypothetical protein [Nocardia iowensis]QXN95006.1 hypothetical protein KV110_19345 [Nocardia iowensis]
MERLSYIDEHARSVDANRDRAWKAVLQVVCKNPADPSTAPSGFVLDSAAAPARLALKGRHWFSEYALIFELDDEGPSRTRVRAKSLANFPGLHGKIYRALVIGTGAHKFVVRGMLRRIAAAA